MRKNEKRIPAVYTIREDSKNRKPKVINQNNYYETPAGS